MTKVLYEGPRFRVVLHRDGKTVICEARKGTNATDDPIWLRAINDNVHDDGDDDCDAIFGLRLCILSLYQRLPK